ncbi:MAG: RsmB/NOP family class I SAM-dependent RNA methyltransferase [Butyrivibrio sp.]|nr:RsmB/NOP family class I SAM-dependent RNA methyltransferase [Butyrivibrio sp.]
MLPELFKEKMKSLLSEKEYDEFISSFEEDEVRHHALRLNPLKVKEKPDFCKEPVPWEENGFYYDADSAPGKHPYHEAGIYYIQEPSAMSPVHFLDPRPGERILDLCAAPGGKSTQIACRMDSDGILVTNEINRDRAKILSLNIERMGIKNALVLNEDSGHLSQIFEGYFDKILVDAPCSGEGMFRKNEEAFSEWSPENVEMCAERQKEILDNAAKMLVPGGRLVYSTCTFSPEENEKNVSSFLDRNRDFHVMHVELTAGMENGRTEFAGPECNPEVAESVRLWPHRVRSEGHFLCVFKRDGETVSGAASYIPGGRNIKAKSEMIKVFNTFAEECFDSNFKLPKGIIISFGDQLYLAPSDMPGINGLKVIRPGLHLGTVKKDRFEPSHALALAIKPENVKLSVDLPSDSADIRQFLNGQTLRLSESSFTGKDKVKGWCLVTTDGYSIGWGKLASGMLKNHYPKGLRINY